MSDDPTEETGRGTRVLPTVLLLADYYSPGWRAGGPIPSIRNMIDELGDRFRFLVVTRDRDHLEERPYSEIEPNRWLGVDKATVYYCSPDQTNIRTLARLVRSSKPDLVFANSLFSSFTLNLLLLRKLRRIPRVPVLLAPRGELGDGALSIKRLRKRVYLAAARLLGLLRNVYWQASNEKESIAIGTRIRVTPLVASDIPASPPPRPLQPPPKFPGSVKLVFTGRLSPIKNLPFLLKILPALFGEVALDVYGPKEADEWGVIDSLVGAMPDRARVQYHGPAPPREIEAALADAHFLVLPSLGENFGHSVYEALRLGRPVVISDQTPWSGLADADAGWDIPLDSGRWQAVLQECIDMDDVRYRRMTEKAHGHALQWFEQTSPAAQQAKVFHEVLGGSGEPSGLVTLGG